MRFSDRWHVWQCAARLRRRRVLKRRRIKHHRRPVKENRHQAGQTAAERMAGERDVRCIGILCFDALVEQCRLLQLIGSPAEIVCDIRPPITVAVFAERVRVCPLVGDDNIGAFLESLGGKAAGRRAVRETECGARKPSSASGNYRRVL